MSSPCQRRGPRSAPAPGSSGAGSTGSAPAAGGVAGGSSPAGSRPSRVSPSSGVPRTAPAVQPSSASASGFQAEIVPAASVPTTATGSGSSGRSSAGQDAGADRPARSSRHHTVFAVRVYSTPQEEDSAAQSISPRPAGRPGSRILGGVAGRPRDGYWSRTSSRTPSPRSVQVISNGVPACTTAFVASSLTSTSASSSSSPTPSSTSHSRTNRRAAATEPAAGSNRARLDCCVVLTTIFLRNGVSRGWCQTVRVDAQWCHGEGGTMTQTVSTSDQPTGAGGNGGSASSRSELRRLLQALTAVRDGDFDVHLDPDGDGVMADVAQVLNEVVARNRRLCAELVRVRQAVGRDGRLDERLRPTGGEGAWAAAVEAANGLVDDLARPTVEVGRVLAAVADGNLAQKVDISPAERELRGEFLRVATTVNGLVDQLALFTSEVTRVALEVGTEGKLGGQARVPGVSGTWRDLTDSVNFMAGNLTAQVRNIAQVTTAVARGDLTKKITFDIEARGEILELKNTINTMVDQLSAFADEVTRVAGEVGTEGLLGGQAQVRGVSGTWKDLTDNVNSMASNLTSQVRNIAQVTTAVARGDLSQKITVEAKGEVAALAQTINTMVDTLRAFADEVTRVAREVGSEGQLGGQATVPNVAGTWKDLTDNVNSMAFNLTSQVRNIALVTTAVARGDLSKKIDVDARGEILELKTTINTMVDQLSAFASEVTRVVRL